MRDQIRNIHYKNSITWRQNQQNKAFPAWFQSLSEPREQDNPKGGTNEINLVECYY